MISRLSVCFRIGMTAGVWIGFMVGVLGNHDYLQSLGLNPVPSLTASWAIVDGMAVGVVFGFLGGALHVWLFDYPNLLLPLAIVIGLLTGIVIGLIALLLPSPWLSALVGAFGGGAVGWLFCRLICPDTVEAPHA